jgi:hypothetical protein
MASGAAAGLKGRSHDDRRPSGAMVVWIRKLFGAGGK